MLHQLPPLVGAPFWTGETGFHGEPLFSPWKAVSTNDNDMSKPSPLFPIGMIWLNYDTKKIHQSELLASLGNSLAKLTLELRSDDAVFVCTNMQ